MDKLIAYKGFDKDLKCGDFQYEVGKEYELPKGEKPEICSKGFHACESPLEVLDYYLLDDDVNMSRFCEVELSGELLHEKNEGSKVASSKIKVKAEMKFADFIKLGIEWLKEKTSPEKVGVKSKKYLNDNCNYSACAPASAQIGSTVDYAKISSSGCSTQIGSSGDRSQIGSSGYLVKIGSSGYSAKIGSSGDSAQIASSGSHVQIGSVGDFAKINTSGYSTQINSTGEESVIMCAGRDSVVKTKKGSWITLAEWYIDEETEKMRPKCVKTEYVDGERIKEDTWYKLVDGEFVSLDTPED